MLKPREAVIRITNACNARCKMCEIWKEESITQLDSALVDKLPKNLRSISLSGGEPFLRNDLPEIVERVKFNCNESRIVIPTNGILTDVITEQMKKIIKIDPGIAVRLSIDGIGEIHDNIRGVKNAYLNVISTLKALKELKIVDLGIMITIFDINVAEIEKVYILAKSENVKFNCQVVHGSEFYFRKKSEKLNQKELFKKQLNAVISAELKSLEPQRLFRAYYYRGLWDYVNSLSRSYSCSAGNLFFYLNQEGNIYPCVFSNEKMGNLQNEEFGTIWGSRLACKVREQMKKCNSNCWSICNVAPGIKYNPLPAVRWVFINKLKAHLGRVSL